MRSIEYWIARAVAKDIQHIPAEYHRALRDRILPMLEGVEDSTKRDILDLAHARLISTEDAYRKLIGTDSFYTMPIKKRARYAHLRTRALTKNDWTGDIYRMTERLHNSEVFEEPFPGWWRFTGDEK